MKKRSFITLSVIMLITLLTSCKSKELEPIQDLEPQDEIILTETTTITTSSTLSETTKTTTTTTTKATTITTELTTTPTQSETSEIKETTTTPKTTTEKATTPTETTQEIEVNNMPEIVFILTYFATVDYENGREFGEYLTNDAYGKPRECGIYIDNHGNIMEFDENAIKSYENPLKYGDIDFVGNEIIGNYDSFVENGKMTGKSIDISELEKYYATLMNVDMNSRISVYDDVDKDYLVLNDVMLGYAHYYGIRKNDDGELEIILLKGRGNWKYDNTDPLTEEISDWLIETIPFTDDYEHWHL